MPIVAFSPNPVARRRLALVWGASTDAGVGGVEYQVQYTSDPTFGTVLGTSAWQAGTAYTFSPLLDGAKYLYRARSRDARKS